MKKLSQVFPALLLLTTLNFQPTTALAQGTAFTYQGRLNDGASPATGTYDLRFALFDTLPGGTGIQQGNQLTNSAVTVSNGLFTVALDFGNQFPGANRWLEIGVRSNSVASFITLTPRQPLTPAPYAVTAASVVSGGLAAGTYGSAVTLNNPANQINGVFTGNGANVTNVNALTVGGIGSAGLWKTNGNAGANPTNGAYVGTADNLPLEFRANGQRALRLEPNATSPNIIGGIANNVVSNGAVGAFIGGGGNVISYNRVSGNYGSVLGGAGNTASGSYSTAMGATSVASGDYSISIGTANTASGVSSVAMGFNTTSTNFASFAMGSQSKSTGNASTAMGAGTTASGDYSTAMGQNTTAQGVNSTAVGSNNMALGTGSTAMGLTTKASGFASTAMGAGTTASGDYSFATGQSTEASGYASTALGDATTASGRDSTALGGATTAGGDYSTALGVDTTASGDYSTAMGSQTIASGANSTAMGNDTRAIGNNSTAMGYLSRAMHDGSFVWADSQSSAFSSTVPNGFFVRCTGGVKFVTALDGSGNEAAGVKVNASGTSWVTLSDRNAKKNFQPVDYQTVLDKLTAVPVQQWNYKWEKDSDVPNLGPMAQDFKRAFYPGRDDKGISTLEFDGVELAAIQGLNQKLENEAKEKDARIKNLQKQLNALQAMVEQLAAKR